MENIGHRIADVRETKGITQAELAKKLKTTQSAVARIESGKQNVSADMLKRIGVALGKNLITLSPGTVGVAMCQSFKQRHYNTTTHASN
jgi:UDP-N-acetylglucosamine 1-carboxyvinyltransferase